jgi:hypothetical protein
VTKNSVLQLTGKFEDARANWMGAMGSHEEQLDCSIGGWSHTINQRLWLRVLYSIIIDAAQKNMTDSQCEVCLMLLLSFRNSVLQLVFLLSLLRPIERHVEDLERGLGAEFGVRSEKI